MASTHEKREHMNEKERPNILSLNAIYLCVSKRPVRLPYQPLTSNILSQNNQPPTTNQQYFSFRANQHQPAKRTNSLIEPRARDH
jgi:hypothetical protein